MFALTPNASRVGGTSVENVKNMNPVICIDLEPLEIWSNLKKIRIKLSKKKKDKIVMEKIEI